MSEGNVTLARLEDQIQWYDRKSVSCENWYKRLKFAQVASAALIPLVVGFQIEGSVFGVSSSGFMAGTLGALIVVMEGLQHVNMYHENWIGYRSTCETLKHEKYLHAASAGPYATLENPDRLLAERIESIISRENTEWISHRRDVADKDKQSKSA